MLGCISTSMVSRSGEVITPPDSTFGHRTPDAALQLWVPLNEPLTNQWEPLEGHQGAGGLKHSTTEGRGLSWA